MIAVRTLQGLARPTDGNYSLPVVSHFFAVLCKTLDNCSPDVARCRTPTKTPTRPHASLRAFGLRMGWMRQNLKPISLPQLRVGVALKPRQRHL